MVFPQLPEQNMKHHHDRVSAIRNRLPCTMSLTDATRTITAQAEVLGTPPSLNEFPSILDRSVEVEDPCQGCLKWSTHEAHSTARAARAIGEPTLNKFSPTYA